MLTVSNLLMANTSQMSGDRKFTHSSRWFGYGKSQYRRYWVTQVNDGKSPAVITANTVIASEARATAVRQRARNSRSTAEISVPEWAIPTQNTKFVM